MNNHKNLSNTQVYGWRNQILKKVLKKCKTLINAMWISCVIQSPDSVAVFNPASLKLTLFCMFFDNGTHTLAPWTFFPSWMVFHVIFNLQFNLLYMGNFWLLVVLCLSNDNYL